MLSTEDLQVILSALDSKEQNTQGKLDPRVPRDKNGKSIMLVTEMLDRINDIRQKLQKEIDDQ
jgi:hypothetical protein